MKVEEGNVSASEVAAKKAASERQYVELESQVFRVPGQLTSKEQKR